MSSLGISNDTHKGHVQRARLIEAFFSVRQAVFSVMMLRYPGVMVWLPIHYFWRAGVVYVERLHGLEVGIIYLPS